jgi:hypothetical protein
MPENAGPARTADSAQLRPHHVRSIALAGAVVGVVLLPIAAAQATPSQNRDSQASAQTQAQSGDQAGAPADQASPTPGGSAASDGVQALTPEFCGTARTATVTADGAASGTVRVQACVDQIGGTASARVYVANGAKIAEIVALNLTRTDGSVVQVQCTVPAGDASGLCVTSPVTISGGSGAYNAIAELVGENEPVSAGVVHVESGLVAPTAP